MSLFLIKHGIKFTSSTFFIRSTDTAVYGTNRCLLWARYRTQKYSVWGKMLFFFVMQLVECDNVMRSAVFRDLLARV